EAAPERTLRIGCSQHLGEQRLVVGAQVACVPDDVAADAAVHHSVSAGTILDGSRRARSAPWATPTLSRTGSGMRAGPISAAATAATTVPATARRRGLNRIRI